MKPYLMSNFPSVRPSLNLQFDSQPTPEDMTSHLASVGATFSRASIGTYTDANGLIQEATAGQARPNYSTAGVHEGLLIEEARTNLIKSSQDFTANNYNNELNIIIERHANVSTPIVDVVADKIIADTTSGGHNIGQSISVTSGTDYTQSIVVKADGESNLRLVFSSAQFGSKALVIDLDDVDNPIIDTVDSKTIENLGNGWYRISVTAECTTSGTANFAIGLGSTFSFAGNGTDGMFAVAHQLEEGSFPTSYIPTIPTFTSRASPATFFDSSGVLQTQAIQTSPTGVGRTDHKYIDGEWVEAGLLLEGASTNYAKASEDLDNTTYWDFSDTTISTDTETDPKGGTNSFLLAETVADSSHYLGINSSHRPSVTSGEIWTYSIFVKKGDGANAPDIVQVATSANFNSSLYANFNISSGTVTDSNLCDASIEQYGDWYRIIVTMESSTTGSANVVLAFCDDNPTASRLPSYTGETDADVFIWGAQLEEQSQPTSYIETTTATVTRSADVYNTATKARSADVCYIDGTAFTDFYNQEEGTFLGLFLAGLTNDLSFRRIFQVGEISSSDFISSQVNNDNLRHFNRENSSTLQIGSNYSGVNAKGVIKFAVSHNSSALKITNDGGAIQSLTDDVNTSMDSLGIGKPHNATSSVLNGSIKKLIYFPRALSDNELIKLTQ